MQYAANGETIQTSAWLVTVTCHGCGMIYAIPNWLEEKARKDGKSIRCPNVDCKWPSWSYASYEAKRLREQLESALRGKQLAEQSRDAAVNTARATKGHLTRIKKRVAAGVCPCCNRTFQNVAQHMSTKHPEYTEKGERK